MGGEGQGRARRSPWTRRQRMLQPIPWLLARGTNRSGLSPGRAMALPSRRVLGPPCFPWTLVLGQPHLSKGLGHSASQVHSPSCPVRSSAWMVPMGHLLARGDPRGSPSVISRRGRQPAVGGRGTLGQAETFCGYSQGLQWFRCWQVLGLVSSCSNLTSLSLAG